MAEPAIVARPYAQAVFDIARAGGQLSAWSEILKLAAEIVESPEVSRALIAPGANLAQLGRAIADICREKLNAPAPLAAGDTSEAANFFRLLAENRRLAVVRDISTRFEVLRAEEENALAVVLTSASPVSEAQQSRLIASLGTRFGRQIRLAVQLDPTLIGGARLQVGDRLIDGSVRTGLDKLATALRV
jgi:F-type H+-transporting ATPase subunit delta